MSDSPNHPIIPVICDRCREQGSAGEDPFTAIRDLLTFEPVPRRTHVNGWKPEHQRAYVAALAMTGSPRQAARALGRHAYGADQLRRAKGGRSFDQACTAALELYREREIFRIKDNLAALAEHQEQRDEGVIAQTHLRALPPPSPSPLRGGGRDPLVRDEWEGEGATFASIPTESAIREDLTRTLFKKFILKIRAERTARLAGRISEADFYARQIAFFEVALELSHAAGIDAFEELRRDGLSVIDIAQTQGTRMLDRLRRKTWLEWELERIESSPSSLGEGDHAEHGGGAIAHGEGAGEDLLAYQPDDDDPFDLFPRHLLKDHPSATPGQGVRTEPLACLGPYKHPAEGHSPEQWAALGPSERKQAYHDQYARAAAEEQVKWEAEMWTIARAVKETGEPYTDQPLSPRGGEGGLRSKPGGAGLEAPANEAVRRNARGGEGCDQ